MNIRSLSCVGSRPLANIASINAVLVTSAATLANAVFDAPGGSLRKVSGLRSRVSNGNYAGLRQLQKLSRLDRTRCTWF